MTDAEQPPVPGDRRRRRRVPPPEGRVERSRHSREPEGNLRDLVGAGPSQLGVSRALRGRDVNRPTAEDLSEAERDLKIVRRHWRPPAS